MIDNLRYVICFSYFIPTTLLLNDDELIAAGDTEALNRSGILNLLYLFWIEFDVLFFASESVEEASERLEQQHATQLEATKSCKG